MDERIALNVYSWGVATQTRLLVECIAPSLRALRTDGLLQRAWCARFDARGPHLFVYLEPTDRRGKDVRRRLATALEAHLAAHPSTETLGPDELARRHDECRGKALCALDDEAGIAPNNSYSFVAHPHDGYPLWIFEDARSAAAGDFWQAADEVLQWTAERLREGASTAAALQWGMEVDRALTRGGAAAADYWRYHATTLLPPLAERLRHDELAAVAALPDAVGPRNGALFDRVWAAGEGAPERTPAGRLVRAIADRGAGSSRRPWCQLREAVHCTLVLLGLPVSNHVPLVLYAWQRNIAEHPGPLTEALWTADGSASTSSTMKTVTAS